MKLKKEGRVRWLSHDADILLEVKAPTLEGLFRSAAYALVESMIDARSLSLEERREVRVEGADRESLLVAWLNEIIYLVEEGLLFPASIESIHVRNAFLEAVLIGEKPEASDRRLEREVKAATYHDLRVVESGGGWETRVLFDV